MARYFIELAYNGSTFHGWQIQPGVVTVQETLNRSLSTLLRENINVVGAGRTDTGVHASHYVAHFDTSHVLADPIQVVYKLNRLTGKEIAIYDLYQVAEDKHARFSALSRTYKYFIDKKKDPFTYGFAWKVYPLPDIDRMNEACTKLFDYTDFTSFSKLHTDVNDNLCTIYRAYWEDTGKQLVFTIEANRFLRNMVRAIVGTMLEIGQGKRSIEEFCQIIESKDRCKAGTSVPGHALFLWGITYPADLKRINPA